ncbi:MAG: 16S rRNA (guanine(527)-N(7))-methyltransferase RsmG [Planctomycetaceae bacterium]|nr:16S rRNA (guanine(527)-N(7))-methyltransferase RsmG [Planctomycetaceae bacterium]
MARKKTPRSGAGKQRYASQGASRGHRNPAPRRAASETSISPNRRNGFAGGERPYDYSAYESEPATREYMARLFAGHAFPVTDEQLGKFWQYYDLLRLRNAELDLTRIMGIEATVLKHFIDSAMILQWFDPVGPVLDIGSGPGFPGVPLAIMRPDVPFLLAESRGKRVRFLEEVVKKLRLKNVALFPKSVREDSPLGDDFDQPVGDVVTRALETIPPTLERILPFIPDGRQAVFMKGPGCDDEVAEAQARFPNIYELAVDVQYTLPNTDQGRRLVSFKKCARR